jgi:hypothetical protein
MEGAAGTGRIRLVIWASITVMDGPTKPLKIKRFGFITVMDGLMEGGAHGRQQKRAHQSTD